MKIFFRINCPPYCTQWAFLAFLLLFQSVSALLQNVLKYCPKNARHVCNFSPQFCYHNSFDNSKNKPTNWATEYTWGCGKHWNIFYTLPQQSNYVAGRSRVCYYVPADSSLFTDNTASHRIHIIIYWIMKYNGRTYVPLIEDSYENCGFASLIQRNFN